MIFAKGISRMHISERTHTVYSFFHSIILSFFTLSFYLLRASISLFISSSFSSVRGYL